MAAIQAIGFTVEYIEYSCMVEINEAFHGFWVYIMSLQRSLVESESLFSTN